MQILLALLSASTGQFAPYGYSFLGSTTLLWGMVTADLLIAASYYSIPIALVVFARKKAVGAYNHLLWKFGLFVFLCATTHLIYIWNIWHSHYYLEMTVKLLTGVVSFYLAYNIWLILPTALKIPTPSQIDRLNKKLASRENQYRELIETANEGVLTIDKNGNFTLVNKALTELLGASRQQLLSSTIYDFVSDKNKAFLKNYIKEHLNGNKERYEICFHRADSRKVYTQISSSAIFDTEGNVTGLLIVVTDLSEKNTMLNQLETLNQDLEAIVQERTNELKQTNALLVQHNIEREKTLDKEKDAKARLDAVFNSSPSGIIITNKQGFITDFNSAAESMFGYLRNEMIGKHVNILTPKEFNLEHINYIKNADKTLNQKKLGFGRKLTAVRRYDIPFSVDVALTTIAHSDKHYFMAVIRDLTEIDIVEGELRSVNERLMATIESLKLQSQETVLLNEYTEMLQTCESFKEYPSIVSSYCHSLFGASSAKIYLCNKDQKLVSMESGDDQELSLHDCWALKANKPYPLNSRQLNIPCKHIDIDKNGMCLPLSAKGSLLGLISFYLPQDHPCLIESKSWDFEKNVKAFMVRTSICLASLKLLKEKEMQSFKDELTGLYNRRFMNETMHGYLPRAKREDIPVTALMIDIDYFKQFNDNYGHNLGDSVLIQVAHCVEQCMRETDLVCRLGGEEFLAIMFDATEDEGEIKANNIHASIQTINNFPLPITVSIGVAQRSDSDDVETLIRHADMALYDAKENGRNQTQRYTLHRPEVLANQ